MGKAIQPEVLLIAMKRLVLSIALLGLAACGGQPQQGVGFSSGAGVAGPQAMAAPGSAHDRQIATVKPAVVQKMSSAEAVKVYSGTVPGLTAADMAGLTPRAQDAIIATLPKPSIWTGYNQSHVSFRAGLVGGQVARVRLNGQDYAHMISGKFVPGNRDQIYALVAHRSGCTWNGTGTVVPRAYPATPGKVPTWYVGLSC